MTTAPRWLSLSIAFISLSTSVLTLPIYVLIVTLFLRNPQLKKHAAYWLMANIGIVDCFFLVATVHTSLMTAFESHISQVAYEFTSAIHLVYDYVMHCHMLLLGLNRTAAIVGVKCKHEKTIVKLASLLIWTSTLPIIYIVHSRSALTYNFDDNSFFYRFNDSKLTQTIFLVWSKFDFGAIMVTFLCHLVVVAVVSLKKLKFRGNFKIEAYELRILIQALAMFIPALLYWAFMYYVGFNFNNASLTVNAIDSLFPRLIPTLNVLIYLALNRTIRTAVLESFKNCRPVRVGTASTSTNLFVTLSSQRLNTNRTQTPMF